MEIEEWKIKFGVILIIASIVLYGITMTLFHGEEAVFHFFVDIAFVPIEILVVTLILDNIIEKKEKEAQLEKIDMILGVFFSEIGNDLLRTFSSINEENDDLIVKIKNIDTWTKKDFKNAYEIMEKSRRKFKLSIPNEEAQEFIKDLKEFMQDKRLFLMDLVENPNLLEKAEFSNLLLALFHLHDELEQRTELKKIDSTDFKHLLGDIDRVYGTLTYQWVKYLEYLSKNYPYMMSITIRTNPFDPNSSIYVTA